MPISIDTKPNKPVAIVLSVTAYKKAPRSLLHEVYEKAALDAMANAPLH